METIKKIKAKEPPKPITNMRRLVKKVLKDFEGCGHYFYITKIIYPAHNNELNCVNEDTADFMIVDSTRGIVDIKLKCTETSTAEDIASYLLNYKKRPIKNDYMYLISLPKE